MIEQFISFIFDLFHLFKNWLSVKIMRYFVVNVAFFFLKFREVYHTKRMQHVICVKWSADNKYVLSGSDEMNIRLWKANAAEKLGVVSAILFHLHGVCFYGFIVNAASWQLSG